MLTKTDERVCPHCGEYNFPLLRVYLSHFAPRRCRKCGKKVTVQMPVIWSVSIYLLGPFLLFWIFFPIIPYSPARLFFLLGIGAAGSAIASFILFYALYSFLGVIFGKVEKSD